MIRVKGAFASLAVVVATWAPASRAQPAQQKTYSSAEEAAQALFLAVQAGDERGVSQILGGDKDLFSVGDKDQDDLDRRTFLDKYRQMHRLAREPDGTILYIGAENWPFPLPLVSSKGSWHFDTQTGKREILFRRIGANESFAIDVCHALARADQVDPASFVTSKVPFHGYYFRALPASGKDVSFVAYPAEYRSSGVMTFIVQHDGVVYERDLGPGTAKVAVTLTSKQPDSTWQALQ
jgi:Protein of unknown function (DUF2950)